MKPFIRFTLSALLLTTVLSSCNPTRSIIADDLYYQRPSDLALGEDANDPTSYSAFKTRQKEDKRSQLIENNRGTSLRSFYRNNSFFNPNIPDQAQNGIWGNQFYNPLFTPYYRNSILLLGSPFGFNTMFSPFNNYAYNHYGYNQWGQYVGYGFGNNYYGSGGYGSNYGFTNPDFTSQSIYTTISGPRGGYNTLTGARDAGGGSKYRSSSANAAGNNTSTAVRVNATSLERSSSASALRNNDRVSTSSPSIKAENRPMGNNGRAITPKTFESRPAESGTARPADIDRSSTPKLSIPRATGTGSGTSQPSTPSRSTPSKSGGGISRSGGRG